MTRFSSELLIVTLSVAILLVACESSNETKPTATVTTGNADSKSSTGNSTNANSYAVAIDGLKDLLLSSRGVELARTAFSSLRGTFSTPLTALVYLGSLAAGAIVSLAFYEPSNVAAAAGQSAASQVPNLMNIPSMMNLPPEAAAEIGRFPGSFVPNWSQVGQPSVGQVGQLSSGINGQSNGMQTQNRDLSNNQNSNQINRDINNQPSASDQNFVHVRPPAGFIHRRVEHIAGQHHQNSPGKKIDHKINALVDKDQRKLPDPLAILASIPNYKSTENRRYPTYEQAPAYKAPNISAIDEIIKINTTDKKTFDILMPRMSHHAARNHGV